MLSKKIIIAIALALSCPLPARCDYYDQRKQLDDNVGNALGGIDQLQQYSSQRDVDNQLAGLIASWERHGRTHKIGTLVFVKVMRASNGLMQSFVIQAGSGTSNQAAYNEFRNSPSFGPDTGMEVDWSQSYFLWYPFSSRGNFQRYSAVGVGSIGTLNQAMSSPISCPVTGTPRGLRNPGPPGNLQPLRTLQQQIMRRPESRQASNPTQFPGGVYLPIQQSAGASTSELGDYTFPNQIQGNSGSTSSTNANPTTIQQIPFPQSGYPQSTISPQNIQPTQTGVGTSVIAAPH